MVTKDQYRQVRLWCETQLKEKVIPFWMNHSIDSKNGGFYNCLSEDGTVYDTTKNVWMQGRQVWMLSKLYRDLDQNDTWLKTARDGLSFIKTHAVAEDGRVYFSVSELGQPLSIQRKIFSECFYIMALAELGRASGNQSLINEAELVFERVWHWAFHPHELGIPELPGVPPKTTSLAIPMILLNVIETLTDGDANRYVQEVDQCINRLLLHYQRREEKVYETMHVSGKVMGGSVGRLMNPGHAIEAAWFLLHWARILKKPELESTSINMARVSFDHGWDKEFGGLYSFLDADGHSPTVLEWSMKMWWPHCESLYAFCLNHQLSKDEGDWERFTKTLEYLKKYFVDDNHGEWYGYLDRQGNKTHTFKGGPYKGFFHVPRALLYCMNVLEALEKE